jgi:DNA-binding beta-propeller fold protein YncE
MPTGEQSAGTTWNILNAATGTPEGTIEGGFAPHNTIASADGQYVYLGARYSEFLSVYNTSTHKVSKVGPLIKGVRPFTVNGSHTLAFTTATKFDGFQVSSITSGKVLFTTEFAAVPPELPDSGPSHGISLSPDEKELYVVDDVSKAVQVYDVSKVSEAIAPTKLALVPVEGEGLVGTESPCAYDCGRGGWLQRSTDGHFVFVGDSGDVIDTAKREVVATLPALLNTKISLEIDWSNGAPTATSGRTGVGEVP